MTHDEEYNMEELIQMMLETGYPISEIERVLGVKIRVRKLDYIVEVAFSSICGELEFSMN
jgi:hypothetical protein